MNAASALQWFVDNQALILAALVALASIIVAVVRAVKNGQAAKDNGELVAFLIKGVEAAANSKTVKNYFKVRETNLSPAVQALFHDLLDVVDTKKEH